MRGLRWPAAAAALVMFVASANAQEPRVVNPDTITLYVPAFMSEPASLGLNVSTVLGLQVWQTLRRAPTPNIAEHDFGEGQVHWHPKAIERFGHEAAEEASQRGDVLAQAALWGKAYPYGSGVVVSSHLSIPNRPDFRQRRYERWAVRITLPDGTRPEIVADLPSRRYNFDPFVLRSEIVARFTRPDALPLYADAAGQSRRGTLPPIFRALRHQGDAVEVTSASGPGWVRLPGLSAERTEVLDFVSAMVRLFRGDYAGARDLFGRVVEQANTPTSIKIDAYLLRAYAGTRLGTSAEDDLRAAENLSDSSARVVIYRTMQRLDAIARAPRAEQSRDARALREFLQQNQVLFGPNDPWFVNCLKVLSAL